MAAPQPLSKADELAERVSKFICSVSHVSAKDSFEFKRLLRETRELASVDVVESNCLQGLLLGLVGDDVEAERLFDNAVANKGGVRVLANKLSHFVNRMYFARAFQLGVELLDRRGDLAFHLLAPRVMMAGGFHAVVRALDRSQERHEVVKVTHDIEVAKVAAAVLTKLGLEDSHCVKVLDALGELIRAQGLVWLDEFPGLSVVEDPGEDSAVLVNFRFDVSPQRAAELNWEFNELLVDRDLDRGGFFVHLIGQGVEADLPEPA